ncbi:MAG: tRNA dihydrouridine synthase DusB [Armatimonadetes bacterium]|nr:tRNA dihydrouridine synthase DusB [Armatimonadota bacterium]
MFKVGDITVDPPLLLAPMEDVTNLAFRLIAKKIGQPGMVFTEFVSAMAIHYGAEKTKAKMRVSDEERPIGIQIFGGDPDVMAETARVAEAMGPDLIDINMGCWVPKVCRTGSGAALLKDPEMAEKIVSAVVKAVKIPVTVKVRAGWDYSLFAAPDLAKRFEGAGAKMLTLHARFAKQGFDGEADWKLIEALRKAVTIPLVGNGDVKAPGDARRMMEQTGCDGVMVGRAAISNPWALARIRAGLLGQPIPAEPTLAERIDVALEHLRMMIQFEEETSDDGAQAEVRACRALRGQIPMYIKSVYGAGALRASLTACSRYEDYEQILRKFADTSIAAELERGA